MVEPLRAEPEQTTPPADCQLEHPSVRFEPTDVRFRGVLTVMVAAAILGVITITAIGWYFHDVNRHQSRVKRSDFPLASAPSDKLPPEPRLEQLNRIQGNGKPNLYLRQQSGEAGLSGTGPANEKGFVHIPIDRAMKVVVKELPVREQSPMSAGKDSGLLDDGEPNSGRVFRELRR